MRRPALAVALFWLTAGIGGCGHDHRASEPMASPVPATTPTANRTSPRSPSVWRRRVDGDEALDPHSAALVANLAATAARGDRHGRPTWIDTTNCAPHVYRVTADQQPVRVALLGGERPGRRSLQAALSSVPIPASATASDCSDASLVIEQPATNRMWELWHARREGTGWRADWGGATRRLREDDGVFGPRDWPGALDYWGASASSLTLTGGIITAAELRAGAIDHALALSVPEVRAGVWTPPAKRTDGVSTDPDALMYGARLRLDPKIEIDKLNLPQPTAILARAVQRFGLIVREQTHSNVQFSAEAPPADDPEAFRRLFRGPPPLNGFAGPVMLRFPWRSLQVLKLHPRRA